jgi:hypothetical protein
MVQNWTETCRNKIAYSNKGWYIRSVALTVPIQTFVIPTRYNNTDFAWPRCYCFTVKKVTMTKTATSLLVFIHRLFLSLLWSTGTRVPDYRSRGPGFDSQRYQIFWQVVGLERGPLSLESTIEGLLRRKSSGSSLESLEYGRRDPSH